MRMLKTLSLLLLLWLPAAVFAQDFPKEPYEFILARLAADDGDTNRALQLLGQIIEKQPRDPILLFERASIYLDANKPDKAIGELRSLVQLYPSFYDAQRLLGRVLLDSAGSDRVKLDEALAHLQATYKLNPDDVLTGLAVVQILATTDRPDEATRVLASVVERAPDNRSANYQYAQLLTKTGHGDEAKPYLERVVAGDPTFAPAVFQLADIYQRTSEWLKAAEVLEPLVEQDALNLDLQKQQAFFYLRAGEAEKARSKFESLLKADPNDPRTRYFLAEALTDLGRYPEALALYRALLEVKPDDPELLISYGISQFASRDFAGAERTFTRVAEMKDLSEQAVTLAKTELAALDFKQGRYDSALERARALIEASTTTLDAQAVGIALDIFKRQKKYDAAVALLRDLSIRFPHEPGIDVRRVEFILRAGSPAEAKKVADRMIAQGKRGAMAAAEGYVQGDAKDEAIRILAQLNKANPDDSDILFQLGSTYERAGRIADAEKAFLAVLAKDPANAPTLNYLGYMWADRGVNLERSEEMLIQAVQLQPRNGAFVDSLGWVYYQLGKLDLARKYLTDASELMPHDPTVLTHLGDVFAKMGDDTKALDRYRSALTYEPEPEEEAKIRTRIAELEKKTASKR
jgi:predicted Zn-dependent protease